MKCLSINVMDKDVIIKAEDKAENSDVSSSFSLYKRTRFPENTDFSTVKSKLENNRLYISADLLPETVNVKVAASNTEKKVSFENEKKG